MRNNWFLHSQLLLSFFILFPGSPSAALGTGREKIEATKKDRAGISSSSLGRDYSPCCLRFGARSQQWVFEALSEDIVRYGELFFCGDTVWQNRVDGSTASGRRAFKVSESV